MTVIARSWRVLADLVVFTRLTVPVGCQSDPYRIANSGSPLMSDKYNCASSPESPHYGRTDEATVCITVFFGALGKLAPVRDRGSGGGRHGPGDRLRHGWRG